MSISTLKFQDLLSYFCLMLVFVHKHQCAYTITGLRYMTIPLVFSIRVFHCCLRCMITAGFEYSIAKITPKTTIFCCCFDCRLFLRLCCFYAHLLFLLQTVRKHKFTAHAMTKK